MSKISYDVHGLVSYINAHKISINKKTNAVDESALRRCLNIYFEHKALGVKYVLDGTTIFLTCRDANENKSAPTEKNASFDGVTLELLNNNFVLKVKSQTLPIKRVKTCSSLKELEDYTSGRFMVYDMIDGTNVTIGIQKNGITCSTRSLCSTPLGKLSKHISSDIVKDCLEDVIKELYSSGKFGHYTFILSHYKRHMTLEKGECYATFVKTNELDIDPSIKIRRYEPVKISREDLLAFYEDEGKVSDKLDNPLGYIVRTQCNLGLAIEGSRHREARVIKYENLIKAPDADHKTIEQKIARLFLISEAKVAMYQKYPVYHYVFNEVLNEIFILVKHQNPIALLKQLHQIIHLNDFENAGLKELLNKLCAFSGIIKADDVELPEINEDLEKVANAVTLESLLKIFQKIFNDKFKYIGDLSVFGLLDISVFDGMSDDDIKLRLVSLVGTDILKSI